ncbi:MAG TPA: ATP-binding cassette domain-containing protein [Conexibacter sp.]|nr:ATP-binding cassette domain-containing protein [Conexibacter sp.]
MTLLSLDAVTRRHRAGRELLDVLHEVTLDVWPGDIVAIRGARRSGKTTLLRVIAGIEAPDAGTVRLDGRDVSRMPAAERTRRLREIGYAPKEWRVASGKPVVDHVALPLLAEGRPLSTALAKAHEAIERVGAGDCAEISTRELSPGELVRCALARALVRGPRLLLVDEPGATAEVEEREQILRLLRSLVAEREELAAIVVSRDVAGLSGAERVMSIGGGQLRTFEEPTAVIPFPARPPVQPAPVP